MKKRAYLSELNTLLAIISLAISLICLLSIVIILFWENGGINFSKSLTFKKNDVTTLIILSIIFVSTLLYFVSAYEKFKKSQKKK